MNVISINTKNSVAKNIIIIETVDVTSKVELNATKVAKIVPTIPANKHLLCAKMARLKHTNRP